MREVSHPGETVKAYLEANNWKQADLVRRSGLSHKTVSQVCGGKEGITATTALGLERAFERPASFWMSLQNDYELAAAAKKK